MKRMQLVGLAGGVSKREKRLRRVQMSLKRRLRGRRHPQHRRLVEEDDDLEVGRGVEEPDEYEDEYEDEHEEHEEEEDDDDDEEDEEDEIADGDEDFGTDEDTALPLGRDALLEELERLRAENSALRATGTNALV